MWTEKQIQEKSPCRVLQAKGRDIKVTIVDNRKSTLQQSKLISQLMVYRGMQANAPNGNIPLIGDTNCFQLGVRDNEGQEDDAGIVQPATGGMSTANDRAHIPDFTISCFYQKGSHQTNDKASQFFRWIWSFDENTHLPPALVARNDHGNHVSIEPANGANLTRAAFRGLVHGTQANWNRVDN